VLAYVRLPFRAKKGRFSADFAPYLSPFSATSSNLAHAAGGRGLPSLARTLSLAVVASEQVARVRGKLQELLRKLQELVEKLQEPLRRLQELVEKLRELLRKLQELVEKLREPLRKLQELVEKLRESLRKLQELVSKLQELGGKL